MRIALTHDLPPGGAYRYLVETTVRSAREHDYVLFITGDPAAVDPRLGAAVRRIQSVGAAPAPGSGRVRRLTARHAPTSARSPRRSSTSISTSPSSTLRRPRKRRSRSSGSVRHHRSISPRRSAGARTSAGINPGSMAGHPPVARFAERRGRPSNGCSEARIATRSRPRPPSSRTRRSRSSPSNGRTGARPRGAIRAPIWTGSSRAQRRGRACCRWARSIRPRVTISSSKRSGSSRTACGRSSRSSTSARTHDSPSC